MDLKFILAKNSFFQLLSRVVSALVMLVVTILITRNLPKEVWGQFLIVTSYVGLFTFIADFGLNAIVVRDLAKGSESTDRLFQNLIGLRTVLSVFAIFLSLALLAFLPHENGVKVGIVLASSLILFQSLFTSGGAAFQHKLRYDLYAIADIIGSVVLLALIFLAIQIQAGLFIIILTLIFSTLVKASLSLVFSQRLLRSYGIAFDLKLFRDLLWASLPIGLMLFFSQLNANVDKQIIALTDSQVFGVSAAVAVGIYGLSYRIFDFVISISTFVSNSAYPILLDKISENFEEFNKMAKKLLLGLFGLGILIAAIGWVLAPAFVSIFGDYQESIVSLRILLSSVPLFFVTSLLLWITIVLKKEKTLPFIYGFAVVFNLAANLFLIPKYGYNMAAWVTLFSEFLILALLFLVLYYDKLGQPKASA